MRILHTSDWHLGRSFGPVSLEEDQKAFIDWMIGQCIKERIDLVVIAGDVFDRAIAPTEAVVMFRDALTRLLITGVKVAVITGNHDGAERVAAYDDLLDRSGLFVRGGYSRTGEVLSLSFNDGPLDLLLLPFLDPQAAPDDLPDSTIEVTDDQANDAFENRIRRTHQSVIEAAITAARPHLSAPRSIVVSHAFVAGSSTSDSERQISIGGAGTVDASLFNGFSYTALGHLHRPQLIAGNETVRYSGTPLAYSFSEEHPKSITIVDMAPDGKCRIEAVQIPIGRGVCTITGTIDELLGCEPTPAVARSLVRAIITDPGVVLDAKQRLTKVYPHVVEIELRSSMDTSGRPGGAIDRRTASTIEVVDAFWVASVGAEPSEDERDLLHQAVTADKDGVA